jgi:hypothetical protein
MLVDIASIIATGHEAGVMSQGKTAEEFEKRLGALLMRGDAIIAIDNCEIPLEGDILCSALTQPKIAVRILGRSEMPTVQANALFTATGNNLVIKGDLTRRTLVGRLDPRVERPELTTFTYNPIADAKVNRAEIVVAVLTMLRAYNVAGRPNRPPTLANFGAYSDLVRGALMWLGVADPIKTMERTRAKDPVLRDLKAVMGQWFEVVGVSKDVTVADVIRVAEETKYTGEMDHVREYKHPDFRDSIVKVAERSGRLDGRVLGAWLAKRENRVVSLDEGGSFRFEQAGERNHVALWRLSEGEG